jgi:hypothetical protein
MKEKVEIPLYDNIDHLGHSIGERDVPYGCTFSQKALMIQSFTAGASDPAYRQRMKKADGHVRNRPAGHTVLPVQFLTDV